MDCKQAQQLFDAYLDGELSPALKTELGAHRVRCAQCRRALALLEVTGHLIAADRDEPGLPDAFTDRLVACVKAPAASSGWRHRLRMGLYVGGPLAAAAVVALAFLGAFDPQGGRAAGHKEVLPPHVQSFLEEASRSRTMGRGGEKSDADSVDKAALEDWIGRARRNMAAKEKSGESLQRMMDLTVLQLLQALERTQAGSLEDPVQPKTGASPPAEGAKSIEDM